MEDEVVLENTSVDEEECIDALHDVEIVDLLPSQHLLLQPQ